MSKNGTSWNSLKVKKVAKNKIYIGELYYYKTRVYYKDGQSKLAKNPKEDWIKIHVDPIIQTNIFNDVQNVLAIDLKIKKKIKRATE